MKKQFSRGVRLITADCQDRYDWDHESIGAAAREALHLLDTEECAVIGIERDGKMIWRYAVCDGGKSCRELERLARGAVISEPAAT